MIKIRKAIGFVSLRALLVAAVLAIVTASSPRAQGDRRDRPLFGPGTLVVSRSTYTGSGASVPFPGVLPNNAASVADGSFPDVFNNETPDGSFGITSPILIDTYRTNGTSAHLVDSLDVTSLIARHAGIDVATSFPSKSELGLTPTADGRGITFMAYGAPINTLDVSNSSTPGHLDITDPVNGRGPLIKQRDIVELSEWGTVHVTPTNTYSGNNGRNVVLGANGNYYTVGNAGNNGKSVTFAISFAKNTVSFTTGSNTVNLSGASNTGSLLPGMAFSGTGIPAGTTVTFVNSGTQFTISALTTAAASGAYVATTVVLSNGSQVVTLEDGSSTANMYIGTPFSGANVPVGAYVTGITDPTHFTISAAATGTASGSYTANEGAFQLAGISFSAGFATIAVADTSRLVSGMPLSGPGFAANSFIQSITDGTQFIASAAPTANFTSGASYIASVSNSMLSDNTGVQMIQKGLSDTVGTGTGNLDAITHSTVVGKVNGTYGTGTGYQRGFTVTQIGAAADKTGKDDNFRGVTDYGNTIYCTKGSGGNGLDAVYQVNPGGGAYVPPGTSAGLATAANAALASINPLPGWPVTSTGANENSTTAPIPTVFHPFGIFFANDTTLYVADEGSTGVTNAAAGGIEKWTYNAGTGLWGLQYTLAASTIPGYSVGGHTLQAVGIRNISGAVNGDGTVTIYGITSTGGQTLNDEGADPNQLVAITDRITATSLPAESFSVLETAAFGDVLRGVTYLGKRRHVEGRIEVLPPASEPGTFVVDGTVIETTGSTEFRIIGRDDDDRRESDRRDEDRDRDRDRFEREGRRATFSDLAVGDRVEIWGTADGSKVLAEDVDFECPEPVDLHGTVSGLSGTAAAFQFTLNGVLVKGTSATRFIDHSAFSNLANGARVEVDGKQGAGFVTADSIHVK